MRRSSIPVRRDRVGSVSTIPRTVLGSVSLEGLKIGLGSEAEDIASERVVGVLGAAVDWLVGGVAVQRHEVDASEHWAGLGVPAGLGSLGLQRAAFQATGWLEEG